MILPRCRDCATFLSSHIEKEYMQCDPDVAPRYCGVTGVTVQPMCFCRKFSPGDEIWRPATTIDDLAKIRYRASKGRVEIRLRVAPHCNHLRDPNTPDERQITIEESQDHDLDAKQRGDLWEEILSHWTYGTVEWRPAP